MEPAPRSTRWWCRRALIAHLLIVMWVPGCLVAAWWQVTIATAGNSLGYLYAVEWPLFAIFGVVFWWNVVHDDPDEHGNRRLGALRRESEDGARAKDEVFRPHREGEDAELRAYNDYLEQLTRKNRPKTWRRQ